MVSLYFSAPTNATLSRRTVRLWNFYVGRLKLYSFLIHSLIMKFLKIPLSVIGTFNLLQLLFQQQKKGKKKSLFTYKILQLSSQDFAFNFPLTFFQWKYVFNYILPSHLFSIMRFVAYPAPISWVSLPHASCLQSLKLTLRQKHLLHFRNFFFFSFNFIAIKCKVDCIVKTKKWSKRQEVRTVSEVLQKKKKKIGCAKGSQEGL